MAVYNVTEHLAKDMLEEQEVRSLLTCSCDMCKDDILAIALNNLTARYVSTDQGRVFVKANYMQTQLQSDILRELTRAAIQVGSKPRHTQAREHTTTDKANA